jgi:hypothetical protein
MSPHGEKLFFNGVFSSAINKQHDCKLVKSLRRLWGTLICPVIKVLRQLVKQSDRL